MSYWYTMKAQTSIEFLLIASAVAALSLGVITLYSRSISAQGSVLAQLTNLSFNASNFSVTQSSFSYAPTTSAIAYGSYSAVISNRSESLAYNLSAPTYLISMREFSHCTYLGFSGNPGNVSGECGTANAWDYRAGYPCGYSGTYCMIPNNTGYWVKSTTAQRSYAYSFLLTIQSQSGSMQASLSSDENESSVLLSNKSVGYASVVAVASVEPFESISIIGNATAHALLNQSAYERYVQAKNLLYPMLSFYNSTGIDPATQTDIEQALNAFNASSRSVRSFKPMVLSCDFSEGEYACRASYPFFYVINVTLSGVGAVNQTLYYLGSVIMVHGS